MIEVLTSNIPGRLLSADILDSMFRLRSAVFCDRLGWDLETVRGRELDRYDDLDPTYMVVRDRMRPNHALGSWRLLPTTGPYMLRDVFPELLDGQPLPADPRIWEISRYAIASDGVATRPGFGFGEISVAMWRHLLSFSREMGIEAYVGVTSIAVERLVRKLGLGFHRLGSPRRYGGVPNIAFRIPMDAQAEAALGAGSHDTQRAA
jgi:acyl homoserine lactone synthase